jgi:2-dehydro-3-deoxyglucarate aldolase
MYNLKKKFKNKEFTVGSWLSTGSTVVADIMTQTGIEWLVIDHEHTCTEFSDIQHLVTQIQKNGAAALVRLAKNDEVFIKKALDVGSNGIIVPMIKTLEEARLVVDYSFYPPVGKRGVGLFRAQKYGFGFEDYVKNQVQDTVIILQLEHVDVLKDLELICKLDHVDGFIIGPYDFSASMGKPGQFHDPEVMDALAKVEKIVLSSGKSLGFHIIQPDVAQVETLRQKGYNFFAFSIDFIFIANGLRDKLKLLMPLGK